MDLVLVQPANVTFFFDIGLGVLCDQPELLLQLVLPPLDFVPQCEPCNSGAIILSLTIEEIILPKPSNLNCLS